MDTDTHAAASPRPRVLALIAVGAVAGLLSGVFGVGGGIVVVPALVMLGVSQRLAAGTSVAAILPTAVVGAIGYGISGDIDIAAGLALAVGVVVGAQIGSFLLARLSKSALFWSFFVFLLFSIASLWISIPTRDAEIALSVVVLLLLVVTGVVTGILSAVLGVGGGIIVVPALQFFFGAGDLVAKGTSLLMMVPGSVSATVGNRRRGNVDLRCAAVIGITACAFSPLGILVANLLDPFWANVAFSLLLVAVSIQLALKHARSGRR